ncbi:chitobiase/beta-hexosaminidase C-terminal domain-containing protein [Silvibacterium dinghuense]|nr:chitobiase/beta-hexosaminidase C-terminal domain-containing protein [Silvibacterium dinghuense]GGG93411.1 hypothetical protein GCM10011586_05210 [Silvibacterium dinghuense]
MTDTAVIGNNARPGLNLGQPSASYPYFKNYFAYSNPGFEPMIQQQILQFQSPQSVSSQTSFQWNVNNTQYVSYDANQWAGATFNVVQGSYASGTSDPSLGCTGTVASSTNQSAAGPVFVINSTTNQGSSGCAGSLGVPGQVIIISTNNQMSNVYPTPASVWATGSNGSSFTPTLSGGATLTSETTDLCSTCGQQSLLMTIPSGGSVNLVAATGLNMPSEKTITLNGNYTVSFWAKSNASTPPKVLVTATPRSGSACTQTYSGTTSPAITSQWAQYSFTCNFSESPSEGGPYPFALTILASPVNSTATSLEFDNISFTNNADTNPTVYTDAFVSALQSWCQSSANTTGPACTLRYGPSPDSETMSNWVKPQFEHQPSIETMTAISTAYSTNKTGIYDFLNLCAYVGATPVLIFPITTTTADVQNLVDFLEGPTSTTYGDIRASLGQTTPWLGASGSPFSTIYLEFGNENWNGVFLGHALGYNTSSSTLYEDYQIRAGAVFAAARARQSSEGYSQTATKWVMGFQTASTGDSGAASAAKADVAEINGYTAGSIGSVSTQGCLTSGSTNATCSLYGPTLTEPYSNTHDTNSTSGFDLSVSRLQQETGCGPSGNAQCQVMVYEENTSPFNASTAGPFTQAVSDSFVEAGFQGVVAADQMGENDAAGIINQNEYQALQYYYGESGVNVHMWGSMIDIGGDCSVQNSGLFGGNYCPRPQMLGAQVYNWCKIGPMVQTSWSSNPTYNLPANSNTVNAISNVPVLRSYAFAQGNQRCMVIVNTDVYSPYSVSFSGTNAPGSDVTTYQFAPTSLAESNEVAALGTTSTTEAPMSNTTASGVSVTSGYTLPAHSVTAFKWTVSASETAAATPTFGVAAGTYTSSQSVTIADATSGATIYYTTDGSTPTTSSTKYSGALTVSSSETISAIAVASGYTNSAVATAAYTIETAAAVPTFSIAAGTYTSSQTVTIADATSGAAIYYTTNGSTPTTSSAKYSGAITVSSTETLSAIAVASGYTNSSVATAAYTIESAAATPVFSVAAGTYASSQTVTIADATSGAVIYYTTNGATPTTSSAKYSGALTVNSTETISAIAVASGYTNSSVATAAYTIETPAATPVFSVATGTYTGSQTVTIADATSGAVIYYTTNGATPTISSTKYSGALTVSSTETISAIAVASGYTNSAVAAATYTINAASAATTGAATGATTSGINFGSGFAGSKGVLALNGSTVLNGSKLQLTSSGQYESGTAWYVTKVNVQSFTTDFTFQLLNPVADGFTFAIQNNSTTTVGASAGCLGYGWMTKSVAVKFDLFNDEGEGPDSTGLYKNGAQPIIPAIDMTSSKVNLHSGDTMHAHLVYNGTTLTMTLTDTVTKAVFTTSFTVNIPATVGSNTAYVGFTGGTGYMSATQDILTWTYSN